MQIGRAADTPLWGAPRIHGELLKLGFEVAQSTVAKYMIKRSRPPGQSWWTFLRNHAPEIAAMDLFVVPTLAFSLLYGFVIVRLDRRDLVWIAVTSGPTAEWVARAGSAWTTRLSSARRTYAGCCTLTRVTTMRPEPIGRSIRTRRFIESFNWLVP